MLLKVQVPETYAAEREYVCRYALTQRLGLQIEIQRCGNGELGGGQTRISDANGRYIEIPDGLFSVPQERWLSDACYPKLKQLDPGPVLRGPFGKTRDVISFFSNNLDGSPAALRKEATGIELAFDLLGGVFFILSGAEEVICTERDEHGRFPDKSSAVYRAGIHQRPIVDELIGYLAACIDTLWPSLCKPSGHYSFRPTHDLDIPFMYHGLSGAGVAARFMRRVAGDVVLRKSLSAICETSIQFGNYLKKGARYDPFFTPDYFMQISEDLGTPACFFIIVDANSPMDGRRYIEDPLIADLLRRISARGHRIGLHASYACYREPERARRETEQLRRILDDLGIQQQELGVRQHYLRWSGPEHWRIWNDAGMDYDSTVGFAGLTGFRCGTSHRFPAFDLQERRQLRIEERPLLAMDVAFRPATQMAWRNHRHAIVSEIATIAEACRTFGGAFELLWHNTEVQYDFLRAAHREILAMAEMSP